MIQLELNRRSYAVPQCWNELTASQLVAIVTVLESSVPMLDAKLSLIRILLGVSKYRLWRIGGVEIQDKMYLTDWLLATNTLTKNLIPSYRGLYGPTDDFSNMQVEEFIFADHAYIQYQNSVDGGKERDLEALNHFCAILYRSARKGYNRRINPAGDVREPFNENLTSHYAKKVARWPLSIKKSIAHWWEGCYIKLAQDYPEPFTPGDGDKPKYGPFSNLRGVAEKGIHGDLKQVEKMFLKMYMMECTELILEAKRIEAAYRTNTTSNG